MIRELHSKFIILLFFLCKVSIGKLENHVTGQCNAHKIIFTSTSSDHDIE